MRRLVKGDCPEVLNVNGADWTTELLAVLARGEKPTDAMKGRYRHKEIKDALKNETSGKCAYCESKVLHIAHGDIEHVIPKSKVPAKAYDWNNLTLACDKCNENKGDYYSDDPDKSQDQLIDPYNDNPEEHFLFMREVVISRPDSMRGLATETTIKLSRGELLERRRERMTFIDGLVRAYAFADEQYKPLLLKNMYDEHLKESDEFYTTTIKYIAHLKSEGVL